MRGAGKEALFTNHEPSDVTGCESIDVLVGADGADHRGFIDVLWQGELDQDAVDLGGVVHLLDQRDQLVLARIGREAVVIRVDAGFCAGFLLGADIGL